MVSVQRFTLPEFLRQELQNATSLFVDVEQEPGIEHEQHYSTRKYHVQSPDANSSSGSGRPHS